MGITSRSLFIVCIAIVLVSSVLGGEIEQAKKRNLLRKQAIETVNASFEHQTTTNPTSGETLRKIGKAWAHVFAAGWPEEVLFEESVFISMRKKHELVAPNGTEYVLPGSFDICFITFFYPGTYKTAKENKKKSMVEISKTSYMHLANEITSPDRLCIIRKYKNSTEKVCATLAIKLCSQRKKDSADGHVMLYADYILDRDDKSQLFRWKKSASKFVFLETRRKGEPGKPERGRTETDTMKEPGSPRRVRLGAFGENSVDTLPT